MRLHSKMILGLTALIASLATSVRAEDEVIPPPPEMALTSTYAERTGLALTAGPAFNLLSLPGNTGGIDNRMSLVGILAVDYYFHPHIGGFVGGEFSDRGFKDLGGRTSTAMYADIPFGVAFKMRSWLSDASRTHFHLGMYYALPLSGEFSGDSDLSGIATDNTTKGHIGLYLSTTTTFEVAENLGLGYTVYGKLPLGNTLATSTEDRAFYEAGIGLVMTFLP